MAKTIYVNLEDDIAKIAARLKKEKAAEVVLVFPKGSHIFSDSINLRLLKKQTDVLGKKVHILTMDEMGQAFAKEAGFSLKFLPKRRAPRGFSDIRRAPIEEELDEEELAHQEASAVAEKPESREQDMIPDLPIEATETEGILEESSEEEPEPVVAHENIFTPLHVNSHSKDRAEAFFSDTEESNVEDDRFRRRTAVPTTSDRPSRLRRGSIAFVVVSVLIILLLVFVILPKADIVVYAKTDPVARDVELSTAVSVTQPDSSKLTMPAQRVEQTFEKTERFTASGKTEVGSKAEGKVYIYNLTGRPITLRAATTTITVGDKTYTFKADQSNIRAVANANVPDNQLPSADIVASSGGEPFNLPAGTRMEITNQVFGSQPQQLFAKTQTPVVGGTSRFLSHITEQDIQAAQTSLTQKALEDFRQELGTRNLQLPEGAFTVEVQEFRTDKPAGTESPAFEGTVRITVTGLAYDQTQLQSMIRERIANSFRTANTATEGDLELQQPSSDTQTVRVRSYDLANGVLALSVHYESLVVYKVAVDDVRNDLTGKDQQAASDVLLAEPGVERVDIVLSPSWQKSLPRLKSKINLKVQ